MTWWNPHRHSKWSLLDGAGDGMQYAKRAVDLGQHALALTDHGTLAGMLEHFQACEKFGLFPIAGVEAYFRDDRLTQTVENTKRYHLTLLAMDWRGWINLQRLTTQAYLTGFYHKPCVDWDLLSRYNEGIYCLGGCISGRLAKHIQGGDENDVANYVRHMRAIFGERFALEIMPHDYDDQRQLNIDTLRVANEHSIPLVATGDTHYPLVEWAETQDVLLMLQTKQTHLKRAKKVEDGEKFFSMEQEHPTLYLMSGDEMAHTFSLYHPELPADVVADSINFTDEIIAGFTPFVLDRDVKMPNITKGILSKIDNWTEERMALEATFDPEWANQVDFPQVRETVVRWCEEGLNDLVDLYPAEHWDKFPRQRYYEGLVREWETWDAIGTHVWRYLLMAAGEIRWARDNDIIVGPGRGSAAGSLGCYTMGITGIDPIPYDLMPERFINVSRKGMPDIDVDFMPGKRGRDKLILHTKSVYGDENVVPIAAFGTYAPRAALKAACRVFDDEISYVDSERYAKAIDLKPTEKDTLEDCRKRFELVDEFARLYPKIWFHACNIQGHPYSQSTHASGVLVKPPQIEFPLAIKINKDTGAHDVLTAWPDTKELIANYGFLKLDYLVINGLERQFEVLKALRERDGSPIDLRTLPVRWDPYAFDPRVAQAMSTGRTLGVWQLEGKGTIPVIKKIRPENMHDVAALNALIRPAARKAGMTDDYARRKHGEVPITYWHEAVEPVLKKTHGLMIYQEQMMEIAVQLGDFTRTEADDLRKAMGKKYREGIPAVIKFLDDLGYGPKFKHNASFKVGEEMATIIWDDKCMSFGGYAFNASHAYAYGLISYHDTLLKVESPADFYAWLLTFTDSPDMGKKLREVMREGSGVGLRITPPEINTSDMSFKVVDKQTMVYGLESVKGVGNVGIKELFEHRPYSSYADFCEKVQAKAINKKAKQALVNCGAFDELEDFRAFMSDKEKASAEEAYVGMAISGGSQIETYRELIEARCHTEEDFDNAPAKQFLTFGGEIVNVKQHVDKNGNTMAFVDMAYDGNDYSVTIFSDLWTLYAGMIREREIVLVEGTKSVSDRYGDGFIATNIIRAEDLIANELQGVAA